MTKEETAKVLTYLGLAYGKEYNPQECGVYHDFIGKYSYDIAKRAVNTIIKASKFAPKICEIIEVCEKVKEEIRDEVLNYMYQVGRFADYDDFALAQYAVYSGRIDDELQNEMNDYYRLMVSGEIPKLLTDKKSIEESVEGHEGRSQ